MLSSTTYQILGASLQRREGVKGISFIWVWEDFLLPLLSWEFTCLAWCKLPDGSNCELFPLILKLSAGVEGNVQCAAAPRSRYYGAMSIVLDYEHFSRFCLQELENLGWSQLKKFIFL